MFTRAQSPLVFLLLPLLVIAQDQVVSPSPEELVTSSSSTEEFVLPVCLADNACAAELRTFPSAADDSSGFSGETPLYDEYFKPLTSFDFTGEPESTTRHSLCICPNNSTCEDVEERVMRLDSSLSLTLCSSVKESIQRPCRGHRSIVRVIGEAHSSGATISSVSQTLVFCTCPEGFQQESVEQWQGSELSITYRCV